MENSGAGNPPARGPRPAHGRGRQALSASRAALLDLLETQPEPTTLAALERATGLHVNTLREHLDALVRAGLVEREREAPQGRGRPAWLYRAAEGAGTSEYAGLAAALAATIERTSPTPVDDAMAAGSDWGRQLAAGRTRPKEGTSAAARREVVALLDDLGFAPQADRRNMDVRLTTCPLLEAAHKYPDVVCSVHLGLVRGALEQYGADPSGTELSPFAEPGACRLRLADTQNSQKP